MPFSQQNAIFAAKCHFRSKMPFSQQNAIFAAKCHFRSHFAMRFTATKLTLLRCEVAHVCQNRFRNCEIPCGIGFLLRNQALPLRNAYRSCEMGAPVLRSGTRVPYSLSQLRKFSQRIPKCCGMIWQQNAHFAEVLLRLRNLAELCFHSVFDPNFFLLISLQFLPPAIIQKD